MTSLSSDYRDFYEKIVTVLPKERVFTDPLHTLAYGTDASFYRLIPKIVIWAVNAKEVSDILKVSSDMSLPIVFRAAGTSLSGQAITDSILIVTSRDWNKIEINEDASLITLEPSVIGSTANARLMQFGKKIGPDPASINSAMIGGIAANNASGMCCGVTDNSYKTLKAMKIIFHDGSELDTASKKSCDEFENTHGSMFEGIRSLAQKVKANKKLHDKIVRKFKIKNTCGYSLNALVDFESPIEIISHLMIGSEGTLGFIKDVTFETIPEYKDKASSLMIFRNVKDACDAVVIMRTKCRTRMENAEVDAAELMDRASLRSVEDVEGMPEFLKTLSPTATAVLVETRAADAKILDKNIAKVLKELKHIEPEMPLHFTKDVAEYTKYWKIRKGLFTAVGAARESGTTCIIEDVAYPIEDLANGTLELQEMFKKYNYNEAIIFGHSLDGNLHFVFNQTFDNPEEVSRYENFMAEIAEQVAIKYKGSLKAEHGTGRNMAPFVELEWGADAYTLMKDIKQIFDPKGLINPGVILNDDPKIHLKNFKFLPKTDDLIDACTECGFCEPVCPSNALTFTPRQRIASNRQMTILREEGRTEELKEFEKLYQYDGIETCATCQLCSIACPVGIDTGSLTKKLRSHQKSNTWRKVSSTMANNYGGLLSVGGAVLSTVKAINSIIPDSVMSGISGAVTNLSGGAIPKWTASLPGGNSFKGTPTLKSEDKIVYFSSCINRTLANPKQGSEKSISEVVMAILERAGFEIIIPGHLQGLCCGMPFSSKGFNEDGKKMSDELEQSLLEATQNGKYPVLCDMSSCTKTMLQKFKSNMTIYDTVDFTHDVLLDRLTFKQIDDPIVLHVNCCTRVLGQTSKFETVANICSSDVTIPPSVGCCGFAGDRGFNFPELNKSALRDLKAEIPSKVKYAFSTAKACEIGLTEESGLDYKSFFYLVERCTR